ncbi:MAG: tetrapyrrole methylase [Lachnospiraceae bacterium]|jgi:tetrapyrrole methylase family protein/MazG family protein|nr:tetrapyrrole methylase [Lachnospiraceae bacterium]
MSELDRLIDIMKKLRSEEGCPWDRAQTHESLKAACIEEAAEVVCGINIYENTGNADNLQEELGDLLLQVIFHSVLAEEEGLFQFEDVAKRVADKMIRRHPHVFGEDKYADEAARSAAWEKSKKEEKAGKEWQEEYLKDAMEESEKLIQKAKKRKGFI